MSKQKWLLLVAPIVTAGAEAFVEYLASTGYHFDKTAVLHALGAAIMVDLALVKNMLAAKAKEVS